MLALLSTFNLSFSAPFPQKGTGAKPMHAAFGFDSLLSPPHLPTPKLPDSTRVEAYLLPLGGKFVVSYGERGTHFFLVRDDSLYRCMWDKENTPALMVKAELLFYVKEWYDFYSAVELRAELRDDEEEAWWYAKAI